MAVSTGRELFIDMLRDIYHAEKQIHKALPKVAKAVSDEKLRQAFTEHREQTEGQIERLEQVFELLDQRKRGKRCEAIEGLIEEGSELIEEVEAGDLRDAALIAAGQKIEHYEIASYGTLVTFATAMGERKAAELLQETLEEEKNTDVRLNKLATDGINARALANETDDDEEEGGDENGKSSKGRSRKAS